MKRISLICLLLLGLGLSGVFFPASAHAQNTVVINEFMPHPSSGADWVELYNPADTSVDVSGWQVKDSSASQMKTLSGSIIGNGYTVIEVGDRLNNGGDTVTLVDASGATIDTDTYTADPGVDVSIGRSPNGAGAFALLTQSTKGQENAAAMILSPSPSITPVPTKTPFPSATTLPIGGEQVATQGIQLSEFMPYPADGNEWVELYNSNTAQANMAGWQIDDGENGASPFTIPSQGDSSFIAPQSYKVYIMPDAKFNNSGDAVRLLAPDGSVVEGTTYASAIKGVSYAKDTSGAWQQTTTPTPGDPNSITEPASSPSASPMASTVAVQTAQSNSKQNMVLGATDDSVFLGTQDMNTALPMIATPSSQTAAMYQPAHAKYPSAAATKAFKQYVIGTIAIAIFAAGYFVYRQKAIFLPLLASLRRKI